MPPLLIHRAGTGEVEELGAGGLPVGAKLAGSWPEERAALAPGDTLLFASDGFAELLDPADNALGFEAAVAAFRSAAGAPIRELIDKLLARVADWRGVREQADDVTFVAVRSAAAPVPHVFRKA
jgi:sigma-B regulation protein RsbU (phosphoserine phosphatase)